MLTLAEAEKALHDKKIQLKELQGEIDMLRKIVAKMGGGSGKIHRDMIARNKKIFIRWKEGDSLKELSKEYGLKPGVIGGICRRIGKVLDSRNGNFEEYKELLGYR